MILNKQIYMKLPGFSFFGHSVNILDLTDFFVKVIWSNGF